MFLTFSLLDVPYNSRGQTRILRRVSTLPSNVAEYYSPVPRHTRTVKGAVTMNLLRLPRPRTKLLRIGALSFAACMLIAEDVFAQTRLLPLGKRRTSFTNRLHRYYRHRTRTCGYCRRWAHVRLW